MNEYTNDYEAIKAHKNYGCIGCTHCHAIIVDGDQWGYTCTSVDKDITPNPLNVQLVYGFDIIVNFDGTVGIKMYEKPPKCKVIKP
jgi:hypothetical protein